PSCSAERPTSRSTPSASPPRSRTRSPPPGWAPASCWSAWARPAAGCPPSRSAPRSAPSSAPSPTPPRTSRRRPPGSASTPRRRPRWSARSSALSRRMTPSLPSPPGRVRPARSWSASTPRRRPHERLAPHHRPRPRLHRHRRRRRLPRPGEDHWIDDHIATPMSVYPEYRDSRQSFGLNVLGTLMVEIEADDGTVGFAVSTGGEIGAWIVEKHLARFLEGAHVTDIERI